MRHAFLATAFAAGIALAAICLPAEARDRPGTPNDQGLNVCDYAAGTYAPLLCGHFMNTASEEVRIEIEETKNGAPFAMDTSAFNCKNMPTRKEANPGGGFNFVPEQICYIVGQKYHRKKDDPAYSYLFETGPVGWGAQYCVRFRARRVSDDVVSEQWSNYACETVPPQPPAPSQPNFSISFSGSQIVSPGAAAPNEVSKIVPTAMQIKPNGYPIAGTFIEVTALGQTRKSQGEAVAFTIPPNMPTLDVTLCEYNYSGHACKLKTIDVSAQNVQPIGAEAGRIPLPATPAAIRPGAGITVPRGTTDRFMVGVDLPGNDYQHQPIAGTAIDCQAMCTRDGVCKAWSWVKPGAQSASAMCWLKNAVPATRPQNANVTSGIKAAALLDR